MPGNGSSFTQSEGLISESVSESDGVSQESEAEPDNAARPVLPFAFKYDNRSHKVLVVDDTVVNLKALERMILKFGYKCSMAQSGTAAL